MQKLYSLFLAISLFFCHSVQADWRLPPLDVSLNAVDPKIAVDEGGNAVAVWQRSGFIIQAATYNFCTDTWTEPASISEPIASLPQVDVDEAGNAIAVWQQSESSNFFVAASKYDFQTKIWPTQPTIISNNNQALPLPQVAVGERGDAVAVWQQSDDGVTFFVQAATYDAKKDSWSEPMNLSTPALPPPQNNTITPSPKVGVDAKGNAVAVWQRWNGTNTIIQASTYHFKENSWSLPIDLSAPGKNALWPEVSANEAGNAIAVWQRSDGTNFIVQAAIYTSRANAWSPPTDVSLAGQDDAFFPKIAMNESGNAAAVWFMADEMDSNNIVQASIYDATENTWSTPPRNLSEAGEKPSFPRVGIDEVGNAVAVWQQSDDGITLLVQTSSYDFVQKNWSTSPTNLSGLGIADFLPQVAVEETGNAVAIWQFNNFTSSTVQASSFITPSNDSTLKGKVIKNRFPTQTEFVHALKWTKSENPLVVAYRIYQGNKLLREISAKGPFKTKIRGRKKSKKVTYSLVLVTCDENESEPVFVTLP